ncbi:Hsp20/alpha crystallin family protein [Patescibacteria group bacterium]|nr:MAG: Hsp20/alpha crystallin family protein [Patescibacteria group bacterium]
MSYIEDNQSGAELSVRHERTPREPEGQLTVDVFQHDSDVVIQSTIAGVKSEDIDISVAKDMVTIKGRRNPDTRVGSADYYYQELYWGPFSRTIILPADVDADNAKASMKNGILTLRLPRLDKARSKKIRISE